MVFTAERLESIFREFEQVDSSSDHTTQSSRTGLGTEHARTTDLSSKSHPGLGLAVVARVVEQLGGQLRVDSKMGQGSRFSCLLPFPTAEQSHLGLNAGSVEEGGSGGSNISEIDSLVEALSTSHMVPHVPRSPGAPSRRPKPRKVRPPTGGKFDVEDSYFPVRGIKVNEFDVEPTVSGARSLNHPASKPRIESRTFRGRGGNGLRILVVEVCSISVVITEMLIQISG
jgi:hypothetical protein